MKIIETYECLQLIILNDINISSLMLFFVPEGKETSKSKLEFNPGTSNLTSRRNKLNVILLERRRKLNEKLEGLRLLKCRTEFTCGGWFERYNEWLRGCKNRSVSWYMYMVCSSSFVTLRGSAFTCD